MATIVLLNLPFPIAGWPTKRQTQAGFCDVLSCNTLPRSAGVVSDQHELHRNFKIILNFPYYKIQNKTYKFPLLFAVDLIHLIYVIKLNLSFSQCRSSVQYGWTFAAAALNDQTTARFRYLQIAKNATSVVGTRYSGMSLSSLFLA